MKLKNLSRLTALLLAMMMLCMSFAAAESVGLGQTGTDFDRARIEAILSRGTPQERYTTLVKYSDDELVVLMSLYYNEYMDQYPDALCHCYPFNSDEENMLHLYPYGDSNHLAAEDGIDFDNDGVPDTCPWHGSDEVATGIVPGATDEDGNVISYNLVVLDTEGNPVVVAKSTMLDDTYHYFQDMTGSNLYVAYLYIDENGDQWIIPLESEY